MMPLCVREPNTTRLRRLLADDDTVAVWWGTPVECASAISRLERQGILPAASVGLAFGVLEVMIEHWIEVAPTAPVREGASLLLRRHPLRAADALQLAAAQVLAADDPRRFPVVTLDARLREAAMREGFAVEP